MFAVLDVTDFVVIAVIVVLFASGSSVYAMLNKSEARRMVRLESKLDVIMKHLNIQYAQPPTGTLSDEAKALADQSKTIAAIKLHRVQTGAGLADAKQSVEAYLAGQLNGKGDR